MRCHAIVAGYDRHNYKRDILKTRKIEQEEKYTCVVPAAGQVLVRDDTEERA